MLKPGDFFTIFLTGRTILHIRSIMNTVYFALFKGSFQMCIFALRTFCHIKRISFRPFLSYIDVCKTPVYKCRTMPQIAPVINRHIMTLIATFSCTMPTISWRNKVILMMMARAWLLAKYKVIMKRMKRPCKGQMALGKSKGHFL